MNKIIPGVSPSMMCADALNLGADAVKLTEAGVQYFHYDIMDGDFVPNFMLGPDVIKAVRKVSAVPADIHLMVKNPERHLHLFDLKPGDMVSVHQESTIHLQRTLAAIRAAGAQAAVALNPATPLCMIEDVLPDLDMVVVMTVNPGFAGQKLVPTTLGKITRLRRMLDENGYDNVRIEVDGNLSQRLLIPVTIDLSRSDMVFLSKNAEFVEKVGYEIELFGQNTIKLNAIPAALSQDNAGNTFKDMLSRAIDSGSSSTSRTDLETVAMSACKAAVKANDKLTVEEAVALLKQLSLCEQPFTCPHGRPTILNISTREIERRFGRRG